MKPTLPTAEAWTALEAAVELHERELISFAFRMTGREDVARDCLQDALVRAVTAISEGARPENVRPWLYRLAYNAVIDRLRRASVEERALGRLAAAEASREGPAPDLERLAEGLPAPYREIVYLRYAYDFSYPEMEAILGMPAATLRVYAARVLERIQKKIREEGHGV